MTYLLVFLLLAIFLFAFFYEIQWMMGKDLIKKYGWFKIILLYLMLNIVFDAIFYFIF